MSVCASVRVCTHDKPDLLERISAHITAPRPRGPPRRARRPADPAERQTAFSLPHSRCRPSVSVALWPGAALLPPHPRPAAAAAAAYLPSTRRRPAPPRRIMCPLSADKTKTTSLAGQGGERVRGGGGKKEGTTSFSYFSQNSVRTT